MVDLIEVNFFQRSVGGAPLFDATLQRAELAVLKLLRMLTLERLKDRLGLQAGRV